MTITLRSNCLFFTKKNSYFFFLDDRGTAAAAVAAAEAKLQCSAATGDNVLARRVRVQASRPTWYRYMLRLIWFFSKRREESVTAAADEETAISGQQNTRACIHTSTNFLIYFFFSTKKKQLDSDNLFFSGKKLWILVMKWQLSVGLTTRSSVIEGIKLFFFSLFLFRFRARDYKHMGFLYDVLLLLLPHSSGVALNEQLAATTTESHRNPRFSKVMAS